MRIVQQSHHTMAHWNKRYVCSVLMYSMAPYVAQLEIYDLMTMKNVDFLGLNFSCF